MRQDSDGSDYGFTAEIGGGAGPGGPVLPVRPLPARLRRPELPDYLVVAWGELRMAREEPFEVDSAEGWASRFHAHVAAAQQALVAHTRTYGSLPTARGAHDCSGTGRTIVRHGVLDHERLVTMGERLQLDAARNRLPSLASAVELYERAAELQAALSFHQNRLIAADTALAATGQRAAPRLPIAG